MEKQLFKRVTAAVTTLAVAAGMNIAVFADNTADTAYATREYVVSEFVQSVGRNNLQSSAYMLSTFGDADEISDEYINDFEKAVSSGLIRGYDDNTLHPKDNITRIEALAILARCVPEADDLDTEPIKFTDVPEWAEHDIDNLTKAGLVYGYGDGTLGAEDNITVEQVKLLTDRSDELLNTITPGESFYGYVNNKAFRNAELTSVNTVDAKHGAIISSTDAWSTFGDIANQISDDEDEILEKLMNDELTYEQGSAEQRVHDMLLCIHESTDLTDDDKTLLTDLRNRIINAKSVSELIEESNEICLDTGINPLFDLSCALDGESNLTYPSISMAETGYGAMIAYKQSTKKNLSGTYKKLIKNYMTACGVEVTDKDIETAVSIQETAGKETNYIQAFAMGIQLKQMLDPSYTAEDAEKDLEKLLKEHPEIDPETLQEKETTQKIYDAQEADKAVKGIKPSEILSGAGFKTEGDKIIFPYDTVMKEADKVFKDSNFQALKINALIKLGTTLGAYMNDEEKKALENLGGMVYIIMMDGEWDGEETANEETAEQIAEDMGIETDDSILSEKNLTILNNSLPYDIGLIYCDYYYDDEISEDIADMVEDFWNAYEKRLGSCEWLSEETKENAIKKITNMVAVIGYPDNYDFPTIVPPSEGGTYFNNQVRISRHNMDTDIKMCSDKQFLRELMFMSPDIINALYVPVTNSMNILAGILNKPFYDKDASRAANLGAIGAVIGHEIGHAFDKNGSQYDEIGRMRNWWTDEDAAKFKEKQQKFIEYYSKFEVIDNVVQDSELTIGENMADFAGMQCVMDIIGDDKEAQKEALESYARVWARLGTEKYVTNSKLMNDEHSSNNVRVDATVASLDQFYELYDVKEGDAMYVAPEDRLKLW